MLEEMSILKECLIKRNVKRHRWNSIMEGRGIEIICTYFRVNENQRKWVSITKIKITKGTRKVFITIEH